MCKGDDPTCADFELHHRQFVEEMARERRAFLASRFAAKGGLATLTAGGLGLPRKTSSATPHFTIVTKILSAARSISPSSRR